MWPTGSLSRSLEGGPVCAWWPRRAAACGWRAGISARRADGPSCLRLVTALAMETSEEWQARRVSSLTPFVEMGKIQAQKASCGTALVLNRCLMGAQAAEWRPNGSVLRDFPARNRGEPCREERKGKYQWLQEK